MRMVTLFVLTIMATACIEAASFAGEMDITCFETKNPEITAHVFSRYSSDRTKVISIEILKSGALYQYYYNPRQVGAYTEGNKFYLSDDSFADDGVVLRVTDEFESSKYGPTYHQIHELTYDRSENTVRFTYQEGTDSLVLGADFGFPKNLKTQFDLIFENCKSH